MLTADQIAAMRACSGSALPDECVVLRPDHSPDGAGGHSTAWGTAHTGPCRVDPVEMRTPLERALAERPSPVQDWMVTLEHDADVEPEDRIVVGQRTFDVIMVSRRSWMLDTRAQCAEVV